VTGEVDAEGDAKKRVGEGLVIDFHCYVRCTRDGPNSIFKLSFLHSGLRPVRNPVSGERNQKGR
jgi:hypothetical protein